MNEFYLGSQSDVADSRFQGKLLEVRVWRFARSLAEIQENMTYFFTGRELGLVRCWTLNEGFGMTIGDKTTNSAVGTAIGDATWEAYSIAPFPNRCLSSRIAALVLRS
jgi:hypothetical protein